MSQARPITKRTIAPGATEAADPRLGLALVVIATAQLMVVLDATIVNVALPHIQHALGFSGSGLEWVVNAYALAFGGLLLLGGRAGDLLGRRKAFVAGLLVFSAASLAGGFATSQTWLLAARAVQGAGAAVIAATALALIATTFPDGPPAQPGDGRVRRDERGRRRGRPDRRRTADHLRVLAVGAVRQRAHRRGGGPGRAAGAYRSVRQRGRFDLPARSPAQAESPPWSTGCRARPPPRTGSRTGVMPRWWPRWQRRWCCWSRSRSSRPAAITRCCRCGLLADRNRTGANLIMLCLGAALSGMFFFLTVFMQAVWGYSALKTGVVYLPLAAGTMVSSGAAAQLVARAAQAAAAGRYLSYRRRHVLAVANQRARQLCRRGARARCCSSPPGSACYSCRSPWSPCPGSPTRSRGSRRACVIPASRSAARSGWQCSGPSPGPSWPTASTPRAARAATAAGAGHRARPSRAALTAIYHHALASGFSRGFLVTAGIMLLALVITIIAIRLRPADLREARL